MRERKRQAQKAGFVGGLIESSLLIIGTLQQADWLAPIQAIFLVFIVTCLLLWWRWRDEGEAQPMAEQSSSGPSSPNASSGGDDSAAFAQSTTGNNSPIITAAGDNAKVGDVHIDNRVTYHVGSRARDERLIATLSELYKQGVDLRNQGIRVGDMNELSSWSDGFRSWEAAVIGVLQPKNADYARRFETLDTMQDIIFAGAINDEHQRLVSIIWEKIKRLDSFIIELNTGEVGFGLLPWRDRAGGPQFEMHPGQDGTQEGGRLLCEFEIHNASPFPNGIKARWTGAGIDMEWSEPMVQHRRTGPHYQMKPVAVEPAPPEDWVAFEIQFNLDDGKHGGRWHWPIVRHPKGHWNLEAHRGSKTGQPLADDTW